MRKVVGPSPSQYEDLSYVPTRNLSLNERDFIMHGSLDASIETSNNLSDDEEGDKDGSHDLEDADSGAKGNGWHSDNELSSKSFPPRVVKNNRNLHSYSESRQHMKSNLVGVASLPVIPHPIDDPVGVPPEVLDISNNNKCLFFLPPFF